jgi:hypothetical protein
LLAVAMVAALSLVLVGSALAQWTRRTLAVAMVAALSLVLVGSALAQGNDVKKTDLVFLIDATGSMGDNIAAVRSGLSAFVGNLGSASIDARYALALYGGPTELVLDFTTDGSALQTAFGQISVNGAVSGFQNDHNQNPEAGLEALRIILNGASNNTLQRNNVGGSGPLVFRGDARKNIILVTDEDSDLPYYSENRFPGQSGNEPPGFPNSIWQAEVDAAATVGRGNNIFLNMLINPGDVPSRHQYGDPSQDVSNPDFSNWNASATLTNLIANGYGNSLQAQLLSAGLVGRSFDIALVNNAAFVDNFFAAKLEEIQDDPGVVPEPTVVCAFGMGLVSLVGYVRRRRAGRR